MDSSCEKTVKVIEDSPNNEITGADFVDATGNGKPELQKQATQLQWTLVALCSGSTSAKLRGETSSNGLEAWRELFYNRYHIS